jgi:4-amino-4-deoxy-L-arabinose transferase-like glycosyltransferase
MNLLNTKLFDSVIEFLERYYYIFLFLVFLATTFNIFYNLGKAPIYSWDEARHGVNAYEMFRRKNYIVSTYGYKIDYWNLKPPVSYWAINAGYRLMGFNPLGIRIFSALAAFTTIGLITIFTLYKHGRLASLISAVVLTTTVPFILGHCARTGDADSIFVLFFTLSIISLSLSEKNTIGLYISGICFALAFLTKSWHAGSIAIIEGFYLLFTGKLRSLSLKQLLLFILSIVIPIVSWALFRYTQDGFTFFKAMINYDLVARTSKAIEGHIGNIFYYFETIKSSYFYWSLILVGNILALTLVIKPDSLSKNSLHYIFLMTLWIAVPFLLFSKAKTKISWYILPIYPAIAIFIGASSSLLLKSKNRNSVFQFLLILMLLFAVYKQQLSISWVVLNPEPDSVQVLLENLKDLDQYKRKRIYTTFKTGSADNPDRWNQSYLLAAELYGDLIPIEGGIKSFLQDTSESPLLLTQKDLIIFDKGIHKLKIIAESEDAYILTK